jgi:hypothetical protein
MKSKNIFLISIILFLAVVSNYNAQDFKEVDKTFKMDKTGTVTLDTYKGDVTIETWDKAEVHVYAKITPDEQFWGTKNRTQLENAEVVIDDSPNSVRIKSKYNHESSWFSSNTRAFVNYKIQMPKTAELKVEDYKSEIKIYGVQSSIRLKTYKGDVRIKELTGSIDLETYKGEVEISFAQLKSDSRIETNKGEITVSLPGKTAFTVSAELGRRTGFSSDFNINREENRKKHDGYNFRRDINGGGPVLDISSEKGEIKLKSK